MSCYPTYNNTYAITLVLFILLAIVGATTITSVV